RPHLDLTTGKDVDLRHAACGPGGPFRTPHAEAPLYGTWLAAIRLTPIPSNQFGPDGILLFAAFAPFILQAKFQRIVPQTGSQLIHHRLNSKHTLWPSRSTERRRNACR